MTCFASVILSGMCLASTSTTAASNALFQLFMIPYSGVVLLRVAPRGVTYVIRISRMDCLVRYSALLRRFPRLSPPCPLSSRHFAPGCNRYHTSPIWFLFAVCDCIVLLMPLRPACLLSSGVTQKRPMRVTSKPANENKARDVDSDGRRYSLRRHEQRLERRETTTSYSPGTTGMAVAA